MGWRQAAVVANLIIVQGPGEGMFSYSPHVGAGNLVASTGIATAGTDRFGNAYLVGDTTYVQYPNGLFVAQQMNGGNHVWWFASSEAGPWTAFATESLGFLGTGSPVLEINPTFGHVTNPSGVAFVDRVWLEPSGDTTGAQDLSNISQLLGGGTPVCITLLPGLFYIHEPIIINNDFTVLEGSGFPFTSTIVSVATAPIGEMILVGNSHVLNQVTIRDLALKGNANTGHGMTFRSNNGLVENVIVQGQGLTGDSFHLALDALPATNVFDVTMRNCYAMQPGATGTGYFLDANFNSCELFGCRTVGGTTPAAKGGAWGFQLLGSEIKLIACHADLYLNGGGALLTGAGVHQVIGGEYETNAGPGIEIATINCRVIGTSMYVNTGPDIKEIAGADNGVYYGNSLASGTGVTVVGTHSVFRDNPGYNPVGHLTAPTYTAGSASTNTFGVPVTVHVAGSTAVSINGTATGLATGTFRLQPGETITPTGAGGSWTWFGD